MLHVIYLHGFLSSPQSVKAQQTAAFVKRHYPATNLHIPQLSGDIKAAVNTIEVIIASLPQQPLKFIGSSMGGFLSTYFVEKYAHKNGAKAVLVNPAVTPHDLMQDYVGEHINPYSQERFYVTLASIEMMHRLNVLKPKYLHNYKVLLQTGDETLDYTVAQAKYQGANLTVEQGGNHSFIGFEAHLPAIFAFLR